MVIVADGTFPTHPVPLEILRNAATIVCCDGACEKLTLHGFTPQYIIGDMDSIPVALQQRFADRLYPLADQETNDLTKAVNFCLENGCETLNILAATGGREDHCIGNIALLADYAEKLQVRMISDTGTFTPLLKSASIHSFSGQKVSVFCITPNTQIISQGLKYPLREVVFDSWWKGTLNEASGNTIDLQFAAGKLIVYQTFADAGNI